MMFLSQPRSRFRPQGHCGSWRPLAISRLAASVVAVLAIASTACDKAPSLRIRTDSKIDPDKVPVIIVGQIVNQVDIGRPSAYGPQSSIQLRRVNVRVEKVLRGNVRGRAVPLYYLSAYQISGPPRMGMVGQGGHWRVGDHIIWFLTWESGVLRTVKDTWADTTVTVLTGPHTGYEPKPKESYTHQVIDILLDPGEQCDSDQWALAILKSAMRSSGFDLEYTIAKLRSIAWDYALEARDAALGELQALSCDFPQHRDAAARLCLGPSNGK